MKPHAIGIDISGTKIAADVLDRDMNLLSVWDRMSLHDVVSKRPDQFVLLDQVVGIGIRTGVHERVARLLVQVDPHVSSRAGAR